MKRKNLLQRFGVFILTVVLVLVAITVTMNRDVLNFDSFRRWLIYGDLELSLYGESDSFTHAGGDLSSFALTEQGVVMVSTAGSRYYSFRGDIFHEKVVSYDNPVLHKGTNATVVYDAGGRSLSLYQQEKEVFALGLGQEDSIISARLNENDWLVVVTQEKGYKGMVTVYNKLQEPVMQISLSTTFVSDAALAPDNKTVLLVTVGQTGGIFQSTLQFYDLDADTAKKTITFSSTVILDLDYENDVLWLLCEKELITISTTDYSQKTWSFLSEYLKDATLDGDGFATLLLGQYRAGTANRLLTIDSQGNILGEHSVTSTPLALDSAGEYIAYLAEDRLMLLLKDLSEYAILKDVRHGNNVTVTPEGTCLLTSQQEAWLFLPS
ncbi:MAG: DUF5711 family protein [Eubacteriales bacterium]